MRNGPPDSYQAARSVGIVARYDAG